MEQHGSAHNRVWPIGPTNNSISYVANWHSRYLSRHLSSKRSACEFGLHALRKVRQLWSRAVWARLCWWWWKAGLITSSPSQTLILMWCREKSLHSSPLSFRPGSPCTALGGFSYDRWLRNKWPAYGFYWTFWKLELTFQLSRPYKYMVLLKWFHSWLGINVLFFSCPNDVCDFKSGCFWTVHRVAAQFITVWTF